MIDFNMQSKAHACSYKYIMCEFYSNVVTFAVSKLAIQTNDRLQKARTSQKREKFSFPLTE